MKKSKTSRGQSSPTQVTVAVTPDLRNAFDGLTIRGEGGFQSLCRDVADKVTKQPVVRMDRDQFERVVNYATGYGEGGFQQRLRLLVATYVKQHVDELV